MDYLQKARTVDVLRLVCLMISMTILPTIYRVLNMPGKIVMDILYRPRNWIDKLKMGVSPPRYFISYLISAIVWLTLIKVVETSRLKEAKVVQGLIKDWKTQWQAYEEETIDDRLEIT